MGGRRALPPGHQSALQLQSAWDWKGWGASVYCCWAWTSSGGVLLTPCPDFRGQACILLLRGEHSPQQSWWGRWVGQEGRGLLSLSPALLTSQWLSFLLFCCRWQLSGSGHWQSCAGSTWAPSTMS